MQRALVFWGGCLLGLFAPALAAAVTLEIEADRFTGAIEPGGPIPGALSARLEGSDHNANGVLDATEILRAEVTGRLGPAVFDIIFSAAPEGGEPAPDAAVLIAPTPDLRRLFPADNGALVLLRQGPAEDLVTVVLTPAQVGLVRHGAGTPLLAAVSPVTAMSEVTSVPLPGSAGLLLTALGMLGMASGLGRGLARHPWLGRVRALLPVRLRRRTGHQRTVLG